MTGWVLLAVNSFAFGGLLFLLSAGFSLIFGLMRIPNLMHGSFFMLGAYFGVSLLSGSVEFFLPALSLVFGDEAARSLLGGLAVEITQVRQALGPFLFWVAAALSGLAMAVIGGVIERHL